MKTSTIYNIFSTICFILSLYFFYQVSPLYALIMSIILLASEVMVCYKTQNVYLD